MAKLRGLQHTCSMSELAVFGADDADATGARLASIIRTLPKRDYSSPPMRQRKAILCNTIYYVDVLTKMGFKEIAAYNGNDGDVVHVMLYIKPSARLRKGHKKT